MKAMILAAGLGTRLKPFTDHHPKALFPVDGKPLLRHALEHVGSAGIRSVIINVHHFADQIIEYLQLNNNFGFNIHISDESDVLLETGGGVKKAADMLLDPEGALIRNVDILSDLDLTKMARFHHDTGTLATLAVRDRITSRYLLFDDMMTLSGWENRKTGQRRITREGVSLNAFAFSGIQFLSPSIFSRIEEEGKFSLTDLYLRLSRTEQILGFPDQALLWRDVGTIQ